MALVSCPDCGYTVSDRAPACVRCGGPLKPLGSSTSPDVASIQGAATSGPHTADVAGAPGAVALPFFPVATHKFIILSMCTFTLYELYWSYQNWKRIKAASSENISPFWRAFFAPLWGFSLFKRIDASATSSGLDVWWSHGTLATVYLLLSILWRLPDPWWLISLASLLPMIPVQQTAQRVNERHAGPKTEARNQNYTAANIATIVFGGLFFVLAIVGTFLPE